MAVRVAAPSTAAPRALVFALAVVFAAVRAEGGSGHVSFGVAANGGNVRAGEVGAGLELRVPAANTATATSRVPAPAATPPPPCPPPPPPPPPACPPPPPPACPPPEPEPTPWDFENKKLELLYPVIQAFKRTITSDPLNVTATWVGTKICDSAKGGGAYKGFYCDTPPDDVNKTLTVASIDFNGFHLCAPTLAGFIDAFPDLALFHANSNNFSGDLPDLTSLRYFYELDLSNNGFSGAFPAAVPPLGRLAFLDLRFNGFAGEVPPSVFGISVEALFLNNNAFTGVIPEHLRHQQGRILFLNNDLSGCLPYEIGLVEGLTVFDAGGNQIRGPIPLSLGCLADVQELNLARNQLYGHVPDVLCLLAKTGKLTNLSLSDNYFHSVGYHCMELVRSRVLDVRRNCILGFPGQRPHIECAMFYADPTKHCPFIPHIPCDLPGFKPKQTAAAAALPAGRARNFCNKPPCLLLGASLVPATPRAASAAAGAPARRWFPPAVAPRVSPAGRPVAALQPAGNRRAACPFVAPPPSGLDPARSGRICRPHAHRLPRRLSGPLLHIPQTYDLGLAAMAMAMDKPKLGRPLPATHVAPASVAPPQHAHAASFTWSGPLRGLDMVEWSTYRIEEGRRWLGHRRR
ncbi:hypothetical protein ZWY2020_011809 [Hordeum vulgare]|nr:hypothetical protein ZWY2020_011809 [Hordeum vulgare]